MVILVPLPTALSIWNWPLCSSTRDFTIGRPRPVPSWLRVKGLSTWPKAESALSICSGGMPMPVSATEIETQPDAVAGWAERVTWPPCGVNLMALLSRLIR